MTRINWLEHTPSRQHFGPSGQAKRSFETQTEAAVFASTKKSSKRRPLHAYQCKLCSHWHIGRKQAS